ncbi:MAG TPA: hypothetical protein VFX59_22165 [Polyangiales bacterium]|nr:hypothetical protein [Polyangiales bacterium]
MQASWLVTFGIGGLAVVVASLMVLLYSIAVERLGGRRLIARMQARSALLGWMTVFATLAEAGVLGRFDAKPPPLGLALLVILAVSVALALSKVGATFARGLPIAWLVLLQSFRLPLEWVLHRAAQEGVMPVEMSYHGYNFDVLTGVTALIVGALALRGKAPRALLYAWNVLGSVLLAVIVTVAVLAAPMFHFFGEDPAHVNSWIARLPFIWLPAVLVATALFGHIVIFRALCASSSPAPASSPPPSSPPVSAAPSPEPPPSPESPDPGSA